LDNDTELVVYNILQAVYAAVRIDLGNPSLNNFILYPAAMNNTIFPTFPVTPANGEAYSNSSLYSALSSPFPWLQQNLPVTLSGPATIQVVYPCQFQQLKSPGALVISVLVATLSMFSTGWAVYMLLATAIAKRQTQTGSFIVFIYIVTLTVILTSLSLLVANRCYGHCPQHRLDFDPSFFNETYALQAGGPKRQVSDARAVYQPVAQSPPSLHSRDLPTPDTEIDSISRTLSESHENSERSP
jgi:hypothetical protein